MLMCLENGKIMVFCNECGAKDLIDKKHKQSWSFCPKCGHVNTGWSKYTDKEVDF